MKKYLVSMTIGDIEAVDNAAAVAEFDRLIATKQLGLDCYKVIEQTDELPTIQKKDIVKDIIKEN